MRKSRARRGDEATGEATRGHRRDIGAVQRRAATFLSRPRSIEAPVCSRSLVGQR
jgi:hypothetical protein